MLSVRWSREDMMRPQNDAKSRLHWSSRQGCESRGVYCLGGWLAYPMHAEATKHVLLGRKSLGCLAAISYLALLRPGRDVHGSASPLDS
jgi:hypothetical protein